MALTYTKTFHGRMTAAIGTSAISITPLLKEGVRLSVESIESEVKLADGSGRTHMTGRKLVLEINFDEILDTDLDNIEAKKGENVVVTFLDKTTYNTLTISSDEILTRVGDNRSTVKVIKYGAADADMNDMFAITTV